MLRQARCLKLARWDATVRVPLRQLHAPRAGSILADQALSARLLSLSILAGGAAGALIRAATAEIFPQASGTWPWATFSVNLLGTAFLAWLTTRLTEVAAPTRYWRPLLGTGLCGALTTFSTFQVETIQLAKHGDPVLAAGYSVASIAAGMALAAGATILARRHRYG